MVYRQRFVCDTSAFTNVPEETKPKDMKKYISDLTRLVSKARTRLSISCYIPFPTIYNELVASLKRQGIDDVIIDIDTWFVKKTPNRYEVKISSEIFYEYITDIRLRMDKGLRVAEEAVRDAVKKNEHAPVINVLRDKYRSALREGILDSKEDLDVLLLAKELEAGVVTADHGIRKWAERLGLRFVEGKQFPNILKEFLEGTK